MPCSPSARTVRFWSLGRSMTLLTCVSLSLAAIRRPQFGLGFSPLRSHRQICLQDGLDHGPRRDLVDVSPPQHRDLLRPPERVEALHRGMHDIDWIRGAERLREDVLDPRRLDHGPDRTSGDNSRPGCCGLQEDDARAVLPDHHVWDGRAHHGHQEHALLGLLDALLDGRRNLLRLPVADPDPAGTVANHHERGETEPPTSLDNLGHAVDRDDALLEGAALGLLVVASQILNPPSRAPSAGAFTRPWYRRPPLSNTARSTPAAFASSAKAFPTSVARARFSPSVISRSEADASVRAARSSTSCA